MKIVLFANTDWYLYNFRLSFARRLMASGHDVLLLSPDGKYGPRFAGLGLRWQAVSMARRSLNPWSELKLILDLAGLLRREGVDLVHGFTIKCAIYGPLAARIAGTRASVGAVEGLGYVFISGDWRARLLRPLVRWLFKRALAGPGVRLVVLNDTDFRFFTESGLVETARTRVIAGSGVDCERFRPHAEPRTAGPLKVLLATRLLWDKGLREFAEAARSLRAEGRDIDFILAGDPDPGNPASVTAQEVADWTGAGLLRWIGHVEDMPALLADIDVFVLPSYREGLSRSLIEAAASGKALIATDVPGCREVVEEGCNGLLVPARDWQALAAAVARLDDDRDLVRRFGEAGRLRALETFEDALIFARTLEVYREIALVDAWSRWTTRQSP
jgi:glycosyltransferase involved in cell wall biosynthesis